MYNATTLVTVNPYTDNIQVSSGQVFSPITRLEPTTPLVVQGHTIGGFDVVGTQMLLADKLFLEVWFDDHE